MKVKNTILFILLNLIVAAMIIGASGCRSVRKSQTVTTDENRVEYKTDTVYKEKRDTLHVTKTETKTETETEFVFDTIYKEIPKIVYRNDGSIEVSGLKTARMQLNFWQQRYDSVKAALELSEANSSYYKEESKKVKTETIVKKKPLVGLVIIGFIIGLLVGIYLGVRFKKVFS